MKNLKLALMITVMGLTQLYGLEIQTIDNENLDNEIEKFDIEEQVSNDGGFCEVHEEGDVIEARSECQPETYGYYYDYDPADRDIDASWPSKKMTSFMEDLMK